MKARLPLAYQILALQVCIVLLAALAGTVIAVYQARQGLDREFEQRSLAIAQSVAAMDAVQAGLLGKDVGSVDSIAEAVRRSTGATYVVVTDSAGVRYSHPNPALIGKVVDENPGSVLAGQTWVGVQQGTLCTSARGKAPVFDSGRVIGMVSVGYCETRVTQQLLSELPGYALIIVIALGLGAAGSLLLARRIKRQTFGLEPHEIAGLLEEREASLRGIREGAVVTDSGGRITVVNDEAARLLGLPAGSAGKKLTQVLPPGRLLNYMTGRLHDQDEILLAGERVLIASRRPVRVRGREIGHVVTVRDSVELRGLSGAMGLDSLTDALRAQAHEFSNRLHVIAGLVELGRAEEAMRLISDASSVHQELSEKLVDRVGDPVLGALLLAKAAVASERGIDCHVAEGTVLTHSPLSGDDLITVLGNLIDNAIDAAGASAERRVEVSVGMEGEDLVMRVQDSGAGVPPDVIDRVFEEGFSTKAHPNGRRRGFGLALVRQIVERHGGHVSVANQGGAVFTVRLPARSPALV